MAKRLKGLYRDCEPIDQPPETYRYANNALLSEQVGSIMSDYGLSKINVSTALGQDFVILGHVPINKDRVVIFSVNDNGTGSKISVINPDSTIDVIVYASEVNFSFSLTSEVDAVFRINKDLEAVVYFTDGINPPRFVNIDNFDLYTDINKYNIFSSIEKFPIVSLRTVNNTGGVLGTGAYYFAIRYIDKDGNKTGFLSISNSIYISDDDDGAEPNTPTSKSISVEISNVDTSYNEIEIAVIKKEGGTLAPIKILPTIGLSLAQTIVYIYKGNESYIEGTLDEILINNASYETAKTIEQADGILYMGNLTKAGEDIGYQRYANNIKLQVIDTEASSSFLSDSSERYTNPDISFSLRGYQRDEVYAFYISFILNNGSESKAYHIPGRPPSSGETDNLSSFSTTLNNEFGNDTYARVSSFATNPKKFHFINEPHSNLATGYWENQNETYPNTDDWDIYYVNANGNGVQSGTLRGEKVRHHRMPDHNRLPILNGLGVTPLLIKLKDVEIPDDIKEKVKGYKIYYAKPNNSNKRVIDQSFVWPLFSGTDSAVTGNNDFHYISSLPPSDRVGYSLDNQHSADFNLRTYGCIPFYSMKNKDNIGTINYIQKIYVPVDSVVSQVNNDTEKSSYRFVGPLSGDYAGNPFAYNFSNNGVSSAIIPISAKAFVPHGQNVVELKSKGFPYNATTINSESQILLHNNYFSLDNGGTGSPINDKIRWNNDDGTKEYSFIANLMSYKTEVYNSFDRQELVWTGYTQTNLEQEETGIIGGGDIFLCKHAMRISGRAIKTNEDPIFKSTIEYLVESRDNIELRHNGTEYYEIYYKGFPTSPIPILSIEENEANLENGNPVDFFDNYYGYNIDYRAVQDIKTAIPYEKNQRFETTTFPTRVIRSQKAIPGSSSDFFRTFLENDFKDFGYNRGDLVKINKYANNLILHMERAIMITRGREELATGDFRAFLGAGDIFAVEPNELLMSEDGTGGLQNQHHSILTEEGYFFVDQEEGSIYSLTSNGLANISDIGMRNEFEKILPWNLSQYASFNPYTADKRYIGINFGYDKEHSRVFFVKRDVTPSQDFITKLSNGTITIEADGQFYEGGNKIDYSSSYFTPDNVCLSYVPQLNAWVSYHTYTPQYYINSLGNFYALFSDSKLYEYNDKEVSLVKKDENNEEEVPFEFGFVENRSPAETKVFYSLSLITSVKDKDGVEYKDKTFTNFQLFTALQDSGVQEIIPFESLANQGNARNVNGTWMINKFRTPNDEWWKRSRFIDKYVEVLLTYYNYDNNFLYLTSSEVGVRKTIR